jgi:hypothetical protein
MLNLSANNIIGVASNWAHAIQMRDSLGHVFRAEVSVTPQTAEELVSRLLAAQNRGRKKDAKRKPAVAAPKAPLLGTVPKPKLPAKATDPVTKAVDGLVNALGGTVDGAKQKTGGSVSSLLDYLLKP